MALILDWVRARQLADPVSEGPRGSEERAIYRVGAGLVGPVSGARYLGTSSDQRLSPSPGQRGGGGSTEHQGLPGRCA